MSGLTKEQLKNALVSHGVGLPSPSAKKDQYVRLYHKYVVPVANSRGDFSSDDEDLPLNDIRTETMTDIRMVIDGVNVAELDDEELYSRLVLLGGTAGPVVDTTRKVYQRQLFVLMGGELPDAATFNGDVDQDEYSDGDLEVVEEEQPVTMRRSTRTESSKTTYSTSSTATAVTSPQPSLISDIRKRVLAASGGDDGVVFDPNRHTPSPRPSLRTITSSSSSSTTVRKFLNNGSSGVITTDDVPDAASKPGKMSVCLRLTVKLVFLALILLLALYFYQNSPSESPFKAVEQLARQALEAAAGEKAAGGDVAPAPPQAPPPTKEEEEVFN